MNTRQDRCTTSLEGRSRNLWMDVCNIYSCVSVIILHCSNVAVHWWDGNVDGKYLWGMFTHSAFICAVPLFMMLSGANLLSRDIEPRSFFAKRFSKTGIPFIAWTVFYFLIWHLHESVEEFFQLLFQSSFNPTLWFFIPLFAVYLFMPFLQPMLQKGNEKLIRLYLLLAFLFISVIPFVLGTFGIILRDYKFPLGGQFVFMAVIGYYVNRYDINIRTKHVIMIFMTVFIFHISYLLVKTNILGKSDELILQYETPSIVIMATCLFVLFKRMDCTRLQRYKTTIATMASCSLGVYLIHYFFIEVIRQYFPAQENVYLDTIPIYFVSLSVIMLFKKTPYLRRCV